MDPTVRSFVDQRASGPVLGIIGELDAWGAAALDAQTALLPGPISAIDARYVTFIDAAGIAALLHIVDGATVPVLASAAVARLVAICGLEEHLVPTTARMQPSFDDAPFMLVEIDRSGSVVYANAAAATHVGLGARFVAGARAAGVAALAELVTDLETITMGHGPCQMTATPRRRTDPAAQWTIWPLRRAADAASIIAAADVP